MFITVLQDQMMVIYGRMGVLDGKDNCGFYWHFGTFFMSKLVLLIIILVFFCFLVISIAGLLMSDYLKGVIL